MLPPSPLRNVTLPLTQRGNLPVRPVHTLLPARLPAFRPLHIVSYNRGWGVGGCSTSQKYQLKGEVRPRECQSLPSTNVSKTFLPERSRTLLPTADRFYCDNCSSALATGHYAEPKRTHIRHGIRKAKNRLGSARHPHPL